MFVMVSLVPIYHKLETLPYTYITQLNRTGAIPKVVAWLKTLVAALVSLSLLYIHSLKKYVIQLIIILSLLMFVNHNLIIQSK
jgi:hypothetical protein